ncbi:neuropeptides B/W receptor type 1-like [Stylophora pistillata]|uniref:neuropeptides B/W receptor type 1-like n=1 Tax=Stylophora pistillata TaxID=50429 RepID=UPI000C04D04B|nr:neuropeptides B/W receptor type 1-like [Stylophora pistillata]
MATNSSSISQVHQWSRPSSTCIPWLVVLSTECLAIAILNIVTSTVFVKQQRLQRRSKYLIINLTIVDLLVGAVSGLMQIHLCMVWCHGELEIHCSRRPQHHSAAGRRERKLTSTLFLVTCASLLTFLPILIWESTITFHVMAFLKWPTIFQISITILTLFLANSLLNPILYAVRMPEFRAGISKMIFCSTPQVQRNQAEYPLRNL